MTSGDYWNFRARFLAGDELSGLNPDTRLEPLRFQRPRGVVHYYAPLGLITRDGSDIRPAEIVNVQDRRQRTGNSTTTVGNLPNLTVTGGALAYVGGVTFPPAAADSRILIYWSGDVFIATANAINAFTVKTSLYSDAMKNPATDQQSGLVREQSAQTSLTRRPVNVDLPLTHLFTDTVDFSSFTVPPKPAPTSVQIFVSVSAVAAFSLQFSNMQVTVIEMKKGL